MMSGCGAFDDDGLLSEQQQKQHASSSTSCHDTSTTRPCSSGNGCSNGSGCQQQAGQQGSFGSWVRRQTATSSTAPAEQQQQPGSLGTCMKCKEAPAVTHIRQHEPYCNTCIETGVIAKFRYATKGQGLIRMGDRVLLALSGGAASLALLWCTLAMQSANSSRPERGKVPFQLAVLHVDCSAAWGAAAQQAQQRLQEMRAAVAAAGFGGQLLVLQLQDVFAEQPQLQQLLQDQQQQQPGVEQLQEQLQAAHLTAAGERQTDQDHQQWRHQCQQQLQELLNAVSDTTGREDVAVHLQDALLLRAAAALGCSRLLRGECACRIAANIIAEAAKGRGFSLPADIQLLDARLLQQGGPAVLRPLREVTHKELATLCAYKGVACTDRQMGQPQQSSRSGAGRGSSGHGAASVNQLAERFIADMQGSVPASIYTILRTASHLQPFGFNALAAVPGASDMQSSAARQSAKKQQQQAGQVQVASDSQQQWQLCSVCRAPLPVAAAAGAGVEAGEAGADAAARERLLLAGLTGAHSRRLCYTCNRQVLHKVEVDQQPEGSISAEDTSLEARMHRLKQLLPAGMLLDEDEDVVW